MSQRNAVDKSARSLQEVLAERGALPVEESLFILQQLLTEVQALHTADRIHRSIGPEAVFLTPLARVTRVTLAAAEPKQEIGGRMGDVDRCPPELRRANSILLPSGMEEARQALAPHGIALDPPWIDIYQLGTLLHRMIAGQSAITYLRSPTAKFRIPPPLQPLIEKALGCRAGDRFADCDEFAAAARQALDGGKERKNRRCCWPWVGSFLGLCVLGLIAILGHRKDPTSDKPIVENDARPPALATTTNRAERNSAPRVSFSKTRNGGEPPKERQRASGIEPLPSTVNSQAPRTEEKPEAESVTPPTSPLGNLGNEPPKIAFRPVEFSRPSSDGQAESIPQVAGLLPAGPGVDVVWSRQNLFLMKTRGELKRIWTTNELNVHFKNLSYDGRYVWAPAFRDKQHPLLLVVDPIHEQVWEVSALDGLPLAAPNRPPADFFRDRLLAAALAPGKACIVGSIAGQVWLALVTFKPQEGNAVKVFHRAYEPINRQDRDQWKSVLVAFEPTFLFPLSNQGSGAEPRIERLLLGRSSPFQNITDHPLIVDLEHMSVTVFPEKLSGQKSIHEFDVYQGVVYFSEPYPRPASTEFRIARIRFPEMRKETVVHPVPEGWPIFFKDRMHVLGKQWRTGTGVDQHLIEAAAHLPWTYGYSATGATVHGGNRANAPPRSPYCLMAAWRSSVYGLLVVVSGEASGPQFFQVEFED